MLTQSVGIILQIAAHFRQQVATDFLLPILQRREFLAEVQATVAALPISLTKVRARFLRLARRCTRRSNSAPFTISLSDRYVRASSRVRVRPAPRGGHVLNPSPSDRTRTRLLFSERFERTADAFQRSPSPSMNLYLGGIDNMTRIEVDRPGGT